MWLRGKSLLQIQTICVGYSTALEIHGIKEFGTTFDHDFSEFIGKKYGVSTCLGWARTILLEFKPRSKSFEIFFFLLEEFRNSKSKDSQRH